MSIRYSALLPHSPLLIPSIGKQHTKILQKTLDSYKQVISKLKEKDIQTIFVISPHGEKQEKEISINESLNYRINLKEFGDLATKLNIESDQKLNQKLKDAEVIQNLISFFTKEELNYGSAIVLYLLLSELNNIKALSLICSQTDYKDHYDFGKKISSYLEKTDENIAVIASGDMSHSLQKKSPGSYSSKGIKFDNQVKEIIIKNDNIAKNLLELNPSMIEKAKECGLKPLLTMLGIIDSYKYKSKILSYQDDFGIGYLSAEFDSLETI